MANEISNAPLEATDRFAIVVAAWNQSITSKLLDGAVATLESLGVATEQVDIARVPGAWEVPVVAARFAHGGEHAAVLCLAAVITGETTHDQYINQGVAAALSQLAVDADLPVLFGILTCQTMEQAIHRAGGNVGNKGSECADAAVKMVGLLRNLPRR